jgi:formate dehydrogenase iron-sulfur subunit
MLMEGDPFCLIEGMAIAAFAVGARKGYVYTRSEYPHAIATFDAALGVARAAGLLGATSTSSSGRVPALMSAARKPRCWKASRAAAARCAPNRRCRRIKVCSAADRHQQRHHAGQRAGYFAGRRGGVSDDRLRALARHDADPARRQRPVWRPVRGRVRPDVGRIVNDIGGGTLSGRPVRAVQVGGPLGAYFPPALFDTPFDYEAFPRRTA